jgi:hypothetical protein
MARSPAQSDFSVSRPPQLSEIELPAVARPVTLPEAQAGLAGELATRWMMRITLVLLLALAVLCAVGPHIPSGE